MGTVNKPVDVIKELRLRRWARAHYVPAAERGNAWDPIVLDEMQRRDAELQAETFEIQEAERTGIYAYVPLIPDEMRMLHRGHTAIADPQFLRRSVASEQPMELFIDLR